MVCHRFDDLNIRDSPMPGMRIKERGSVGDTFGGASVESMRFRIFHSPGLLGEGDETSNVLGDLREENTSHHDQHSGYSNTALNWICISDFDPRSEALHTHQHDVRSSNL
jgi:hypothetical protein